MLLSIAQFIIRNDNQRTMSCVLLIEKCLILSSCSYYFWFLFPNHFFNLSDYVGSFFIYIPLMQGIASTFALPFLSLFFSIQHVFDDIFPISVQDVCCGSYYEFICFFNCLFRDYRQNIIRIQKSDTFKEEFISTSTSNIFITKSVRQGVPKICLQILSRLKYLRIKMPHTQNSSIST